jgi:hypothetical protein
MTYHEPSKTVPKGNGSLVVCPFNILAHPFKHILKIMVRATAPIANTGIRESLPEASAARYIWGYHDIALFGKHRWVPTGAPRVFPRCVRSTMYKVGYRISLFLIEGAGFEDPGMHLRRDLWIRSRGPDTANLGSL